MLCLVFKHYSRPFVKGYETNRIRTRLTWNPTPNLSLHLMY